MKPDPLVEAFGSRSPQARLYQERLATDAITQGLLGPNEADTVLTRHLLPCAAIGQVLPTSPEPLVLDIGAGAGLPGLPVALARPDVPVVLVEPLLRRVRFLEAVVAELELQLPDGSPQVRVERRRAQEVAAGQASAVVARAVAPALRLAAWCMPALRPGGVLVAAKGQRLEEELVELEPHLRTLDISAVDQHEVSDVAGGVVRLLCLTRGSKRIAASAARDLGRSLKGPDLRRG